MMTVSHENIVVALVSKDVRISALEAEVASQRTRIAELEAAVANKDALIAELHRLRNETTKTDGGETEPPRV